MKSAGNSYKMQSDDNTIKSNIHNGNGRTMKAAAKKNTAYLSNGNGEEAQSTIIHLKDHNRNGQEHRIFITVNSTSRFIKVSDIVCITAEKDYTYICTADDKKLLVLRPMIEWEDRLPKNYFARIHRSTIVNLDFIEKVEKWFNYAYHVYVQNRDEPFQMSRRYATKLKERFR